MSDWTSATIGDLCDIAYGKILTKDKLSDSGFPVWSGYSVIGYHSSYMYEEPQVTITCRGVGGTGDVHMTPPRSWVTNLALIMSPKSDEVLNRDYLYWAMLASPRRQLITGSAQYQITIANLSKHKIPVPPLEEQIRLVSAFGPFDKKIICNQSMMALIEKMAVSLFQSWFVDFDPVRAKAEGCIPAGMDGATAALFPDSFTDSELGDIPSGWQATTLATIVTERTARVGMGNGHVVLSAVSSGELKRSDEHFDKQVHSQDTSKYKAVEQWDYAYNPSRINIGSIGMLEQPALGAVSPVYTVVRPAEGYAWFLRFFLDLPQTQEIINQFCSGSVRQSLSFKDFASIPVVLPPVAVAQAFARYWMELDATRKQLNAESRQLAEIRDTLLPKLMSGELRVPETLMA